MGNGDLSPVPPTVQIACLIQLGDQVQGGPSTTPADTHGGTSCSAGEPRGIASTLAPPARGPRAGGTPESSRTGRPGLLRCESGREHAAESAHFDPRPTG